MAVMPFRWVGRQRADAIAAALRTRLTAWHLAWVGEQAGDSTVRFMPPSLHDAGVVWRAAAMGAGRIYVEAPQSAAAQLGACLVGAPDEESAGLAARLGGRALDDLLRTLAGAPQAAIEPNAALARQETRARQGGVAIRCTLAGLEAAVYLDAAACDALAPVKRTASTATLVPRREALATTTAPLSIVLDLGSAALSDVAGLKPGDLLQTRVPVGSLLKLVAQDGRVVRTGTLTIHADHRALRVQ